MNDKVVNYIRQKRIDSFQKLRLLLFFYHHPEVKGAVQELAEQLYLGNIPLLAAMLADLHQVGLLDQFEEGYRLRNEPEVNWFVRTVAGAFEHPLTRLELLNQLRPQSSC
jgi:hypothetical protein